MAILIGIDEAGYGPLLGPLVVSAAVFEVPDEKLSEPLWDVLRASVSKTRTGSRGRVIINDSKKLHNKKGDYSTLARNVLACLAAVDGKETALPETLSELLHDLNWITMEELSRYPWHTGPQSFKLEMDRDDISIAANALRHDMKEQGVRLLGMWTIPLTVANYNKRVEAANNKATALFALICQHIYKGLTRFGGQNLQIMVDRQGGRSHYRQPLQKMFPDMQMKILKEQDTLSSYQMTGSSNAMKLHFLQKGDSKQLPIALASMTSKLVREIFMERLNAYFLKLVPDLKPTAGYYQDGQRFLADLKAAGLSEKKVFPDLLIRSR